MCGCAGSSRIHVYLVCKRGRRFFRVHLGGKTILTTTRIDCAHEWIAKSITDRFRFYLVLTHAAYAQTYSRFGRVKLFDPFSGNSKELDIVRNGIVSTVSPITVWFWNIFSFLLEVKYIVDMHCRNTS